MEVQPRPRTMKGPAEWFTGEVWVDGIAQGHGPSPMSVGSVHFTPCRAHRMAPSLHRPDVVRHRRRRTVQLRGGPVITIRPGDIIRIDGNEWHWHGAAHDHFMTHIAITEGDTEWGQHLTDAEYDGDTK